MGFPVILPYLNLIYTLKNLLKNPFRSNAPKQFTKTEQKATGSEFTTYCVCSYKGFTPVTTNFTWKISLTNSMSAKKSTACCLCLSRQVGWISRLEIFIYFYNFLALAHMA